LHFDFDLTLTGETIVNSNDIPPVPQFLLRDADHAFVSDVLAKSDQNDDGREGEAAAPLLDLSGLDLLAPPQVEPFDQPALDASAAGLAPPAPLPVPAPITGEAENSAPPGHGYSATDAALFRSLTGYHLDARARLPRAMDDAGNRASIPDRLFTTLAEETFKLADRQRRLGACADRDLTIDDLAASLASVRRAAAAIGSRGLIAFETLEAAMARLSASLITPPAPTGSEAIAA
jgi:hypothetical protein